MYTVQEFRTIIFSLFYFSIANIAISILSGINLILFLFYDIPISSILFIAIPAMFLMNIYVDKLVEDSKLLEHLEKMRDDYDS